MSNALISLQGQSVAGAFGPLAVQQSGSELSENIGGNFAVVSIKGKVFQIKHQKQTIPLMVVHEGVQFPAPYLDVVIARANGALSKTYYKDGYTDGSDASPDCWSEDGVYPQAPVAQRPINPATGMNCTDCATCPMNAFGSKVNTATGTNGKACADTRKMAIVPSQDLINDRFNGPMLFRTPAASLKGLAEYDRMLSSQNIPYYAVVTRLTFDTSMAYPKLVFAPVRMLTDAEAPTIIALRTDPRVDILLSSGQASAPAAPSTQALGPVPGAFAAPAPDAHLYPPQAAPAPVYAAPAPAAPTYAPPPPPAAPAPVYAAPAPVPVPVPAPVPVPQPAAIPPAAVTYPSHISPMPAPAPAPPAPSAGLVFGAPMQPAPMQAAPAPMPAAPAPGGIVANEGFFTELDSLIGS